MLHRILKKTGFYFARILLGLLVVAGLLVWLLGTESALRWSARQAEHISGGRLTLHEVHGSLYGQVRIAAASFQTDEKRFEVQEAEFDWSPRALLNRHVKVNRLTVQELRIIETQPGKPIELPQTLHLPLTLSAPAIKVERLVFKSGRTEQRLSAIDLGVDNLGGSYKLTLRGIASAWGKAEGEMVLGDTRPFPVTARVGVQQKGSDAYRANANVSGHLAHMQVKAKASGFGGRAEVDTTLNPFESIPVGQARITASAINPAHLNKDWPQADLSADIALTPLSAARVEGHIKLRNTQPGAWDKARLPLRNMAARFSGTAEHLDMQGIRLDLAGAGEFKGAGQVRGKHLQLDLSSTGFNPQGLHGKMRAMRLAGDIHLQVASESQQLLADLRYQQFRLHLDARKQGDSVELRKALVQSGSGSLALHGALGLKDAERFNLTGTLQKFNPADFGDYPAALLNATFSGAGQLAGVPQVALEFTVADSQFRQQPLSGQGKLNVSATHIWNSDFLVQLARNRVEAKGALGAPGDRLNFQIEADNLALIDPELGGQVHAAGTLEGTFANPSGNFDAQADGLTWGKDYRLAGLRAKGRLDEGVHGPLVLDAALHDLATPQLRLDQASLTAHGTRDKHTLQLQARNPDFDGEGHLAGGWSELSGWTGLVSGLVNRGRYAFALKSPAKLELNPTTQHYLLNNARIDALGAHFTLFDLAYDAGQLASRGEFNSLALAHVQRHVAQIADLKNDLTLGGEWRFTLRDKLDGHLALWREHGDITAPTEPVSPLTALGLRRLALTLDVSGNRLQGRLEAAGARLGSLKADGQGMLSHSDDAWSIDNDAPLRANADLSISSLAWIAPLLDNSGALAFDGELKAGVQVAGTYAQPKLSGTLSGERFSVALPRQELRFTDGRFQAKFRDHALHIDSFSARSGAASLSGQGRLTLEGESPALQLALKADQPGAGSLALNGTLDLKGAKHFDLTGSLQKFNPAAFGDYPAVLLNATFSGAGSLAEQPQATLEFALADSYFRQHPFSGQGKLNFDQAVHLEKFTARSGDVSLSANGQLTFEDASPIMKLALTADKPSAGNLALNGTLALKGGKPFELTGALQKFNPAAFGDYPAALLNATFSGTGSLADKPQATLEFALADSYFRQHPFSGQGKLNIDQAVHLEKFTARSGDVNLSGNGQLTFDGASPVMKLALQAEQPGAGNLALNGTLALKEGKPFELAGTLQKLNPAAFGDYPSALLNATFSGAGSLADQPQATLEFALADSYFQQHPFSGQGKLSFDQTLNLEKFTARSGDVNLSGNGRVTFDGASPVMKLALTADQPDAGNLALHGTLALKGRKPFELAGTLQKFNPAAFGDYPAALLNATFSGTGRLAEKPQATLEFALADSYFRQHPFSGQGKLNFDKSLHLEKFTARSGDISLSGNGRMTFDGESPVIKLALKADQPGAGNLALHGTLALKGSKPFELAGTLQKFNPASFGGYPAARLNATFSGAGQLEDEPQATLEFALADSQFRKQPLSGKGKLSVSATHFWNSDFTLRLARNRLEAKGALGAPGDRLDYRIEADNLSLLAPELSGKIQASGALHGLYASPTGNFDLQAHDLSWRKDYRVATLRAKGRLDEGVTGPLVLDAALQNLATPQLNLDSASLTAQGTRTKHTLQFQAKNPDLDMKSHLAGGWREETGWSGRVSDMVNRGRYAFALKSPAKLELNPAKQHYLLNNARLDSTGAHFILHELAFDAGQIASRGEFKNLPLANMQRYAAQLADLKTDLALNGEWRFTARDQVDGHVALWRSRGDIAVPTDPQTALGLSNLALNLDVTANRVAARLEASGAKLGNLKADAHGMISRSNDAWGIAGDAPVRANADLSIASVAWIAPLLDKSGALTFDGDLKATAQVEGTIAQPKLTGALTGERFTFALPFQGLRFTDGRFHAKLRDQALHLESYTARSGDGKISGHGRLAFEGTSPVMQLALKADKLEVLSRSDRQVTLSGNADAAVAGKNVRIAAKLKADQGVIELPRADTPTSSEDVVVLGRTKAAEKEKKAPLYALNLDLDLDLGERFFIKGRGLDAQLAGALKLTSADGAAPSARGNIRAVKGTYSAYGQRLEIEHGVLNFQGPLDDPGLNIVALRKNQEVEAGVSLTGTAQAPRIKLTSTPSVPDSEKLSWLVLGHGFADSGQEFSALQAAAGALLADGESLTLQQKIAHATGLEEVSLKGTGKLGGSVLALGKRLSSNAYLSYEQGLAGAGSLVKINYALTKHLSVRAQAGTTPAVDLFYTFSFD